MKPLDYHLKVLDMVNKSLEPEFKSILQKRAESDAKIADATKVLLLPESSLDRNDPQSLMYCGNTNEKAMEEERYCPNCQEITMQGIADYDPDDPNSGQIWVCSKCGESVDIVENTF